MHAAVLNNRRHILTVDAAGEVALFDVLSCRVVESFGVCSFEEKLMELFEPVSAPSWFSCETNSGERCSCGL